MTSAGPSSTDTDRSRTSRTAVGSAGAAVLDATTRRRRRRTDAGLLGHGPAGDRVGELVGRDHGDRQHETGGHQQPGRVVDVLGRVLDHEAPAGLGLGGTEAQERQAGLDQQADAEQLRGLHRGHRGHRRQHVHQVDPQRAQAVDPGGVDVEALPDRLAPRSSMTR